MTSAVPEAAAAQTSRDEAPLERECRSASLLFRGPTDHINTRISHSRSKAHYEGDARDILLCRTLLFMQLLGPDL